MQGSYREAVGAAHDTADSPPGNPAALRRQGRHDAGNRLRKRHTTDEIKKQEMLFRSKLLGASGVSFNLLPVHPLGIVDIQKPDLYAIPGLADVPPLIQPEHIGDVAPKPTLHNTPPRVDPVAIITPVLERTAAHLTSLSWLDTSEQHDLTKIFMAQVARRYHEIRETLVQQNTFSSPQINLLMSLILDRVSDQSDLALEKCRHRRKQMDALGVMGPQTIKGRLSAMYRLELNRRIIIRDLLAQVMNEITHGIVTLEAGPDWQQLFMSQLEDLQHRLPEEVHVQLQEDSERIKQLHEKYRRARLAEPFHKYNSHLSKEEQEEILKNHDMVLSDLNGLINSTPRKTISKERERAQRTLRDGTDYSSQREAEAADTALAGVSEDEFENEELQLSTMAEFSLLVRGDPILDAHANATTFDRRKHDDQKPRSPRKRYLPQSEVKRELLTSYDYSIIDEIPVSATQPPPPIPDYIPIMATDGTVLRAADFRVSKRTPKGTVSLDPSPPVVVSEFSGMIDQATLEALDGRFARYKEVEELYDEIMKTLNIRNWQAEVDEGDEGGSCPAAPFEPGMPVSYAFQGLSMPKKRLLPSTSQSQSAPTSPQTRPRSAGPPEIRLRTSLTGIDPKEYFRNRKSAMKKTPSSKTATHTKFNFGGYVPADVAAHLKHPDNDINQVSVEDYVGFLKTRASDFILEILADQDEDEQAYKRFMEEQDRLRREEKQAEQSVKLQKERQARYKTRRQMTSFSEGNWNPLILDYFDVLKNNEIPPELDVENGGGCNMDSGYLYTKSGSTIMQTTRTFKQPTSTIGASGMGHSPSNSASSNGNRNRTLGAGGNTKKLYGSVPSNSNFSSMSVSSRVTAEDSPPPVTNLRAYPSMINIHQAQEDLHKIWVDLKTPFGEQCRMAAIYGSHRYSSKLEKTVAMWREAGRRVLEREALIQKLKAFEKDASNPDRFFGHGHDISSEFRMKEATQREEIMNELKNTEEGVMNVARALKSELKETLTYEGVPYIDRMTRDMTDIVYEAGGRSARPSSAPGLPPISITKH
ncbi:hypothetical protein SeLEV6574_g00153 [Synchytrium endobioticum]|uniref:Uncharacterized protein n=1 Tax=Synchytrium endobioticum TaxID=286115 RepID=A0A507DKC0_9FUNG|nr:hypothetical protein SeLEV6574_g00153 [Synchytrium endobioticum]